MAAGLSSLTQVAGGVPQGYVRLLVFGRDSTLLDSKLQQLSASAYHNYEPLSIQLIVPQDGYVTAYVGNGSDVDVFFDDVQVEHRPGLQVQQELNHRCLLSASLQDIAVSVAVRDTNGTQK